MSLPRDRYRLRMHLSKLKLSGFKSFVDPTTVPFPSKLIGVVGPNGCGKSNIIDAVRWVMGESSAKHLRGDSMADVIFSGSSSRKPVGQASVELVFDNSDGSLGGEYANYNEISIKRTVSRDGHSVYYLNGTKCRRRDITDIFLGTGLGPRSYAIIEQGTISRIIEAKPEELRVFLEEAAGISKYKERRRETVNRIKHTRDNLDRLSDLRDELDKQLARLKRQSRTAARYKVLREDERLAKGQLQALRWQDINSHYEETELVISKQQIAVEGVVAKQRAVETDIEKQRQDHTEASDKFNQIQTRFYSVGSDIARLEQSIQHAKERRQQIQTDIRQAENEWNQAQAQLNVDRQRIESLEKERGELEPQLSQLEEAAKQSAQKFSDSEQAMQQWQSSWDDINKQAMAPAQAAEVQRTRIENFDKTIADLLQRKEKLEEELHSISPEKFNQEIDALQQQLGTTTADAESRKKSVESSQQQITQAREEINSLNNALHSKRDDLQSIRGRCSSLEALQQAALGKEDSDLNQWLNARSLSDAPRLAEELNVESGWERAVESVLGHYLQAICINDTSNLASQLTQLENGSVALFDTTAISSTESLASNALLEKVNSSYDLKSVLGNVVAANTLDDALALRSSLGLHQSVITPEGVWLGQNWIRYVKNDASESGILQREQEIKSLHQGIDSLDVDVKELQAKLEQQQQQLKNVESERDAQQATLNQTTRQLADVQAQLNAKKNNRQQVESRQGNLQTEFTQAEEKITQAQNDAREARGHLQKALDSMAELEKQRNELSQQRDVVAEQLTQSRIQSNEDRDALQKVTIRVETLRTELSSTQQTLERMESQLEQLTSRRDELSRSFDDGEAPLVEMAKDIEQQLAQRAEVESQMKQARDVMTDIEQQLQKLEESRSQVEQEHEEARNLLEQTRINWQEQKVRRQTIEEQVVEVGFELKVLIQEMPEEANIEAWKTTVEELEGKIHRLGPINLAAIDEFEQESERKEYLDAQNEDLVEALKTLEDAISKIDRETRTRFSDTFDKVNVKLKELFPRLFGGGHAYLELTGDDILEAGVTVMARPPGKRNSTIHLLSGGEKALTAVAMVFSIFELNPAPFCMLDEVDAPLDDANVGRYSQLVKDMSERIQFIFITHNKVTMEIADHLTGVTMSEPGVSRMVAVDVEEAVELAAV
ncbi:Chromosome partition protein smc [hydrothermal vent metagenome]|uniref:Chromosome partition protein smc n=1 Tax=hydrothermal vent metagenome TaxID=652676 RepID=A0A3B1A6D8_9ZZZZ